MDVISAVLGFAMAIFGPAALVGAITAAIVKWSVTRRGLAPAEATAKARRGFWIAFTITVALTLLLLGLCIAAFVQLERQGG